MLQCSSIGCGNLRHIGSDFCFDCVNKHPSEAMQRDTNMSAKYPQYFKDVSELAEVDVYAIHHLFEVDDPAGCIQHASKKLLLSGVRTGGKSKYQDIQEARDTLNRWLELNS